MKKINLEPDHIRRYGQSKEGNMEVVVEKGQCFAGAYWLEHGIEAAIDAAKDKDFDRTVDWLTLAIKRAGLVDACGLVLNNTPLENAIRALCPRDWTTIQLELGDYQKSLRTEMHKRWGPGPEEAELLEKEAKG